MISRNSAIPKRSGSADAGRRHAARAVSILLLGAVGLCTGASAQGFPGRVITLVVGYPSGGSNDIAARIIAPKLGQILQTTVVVENRAGANAVIGSNYVAKSAPDGNTLLLASASPLVIAPHTFAKEVPPLPGAGLPVISVARGTASRTDWSPRARIVSPLMTSTLAGVSSGVRPMRLHVYSNVDSTMPG